MNQITFPLYVKSEFLGPYGKGESYKPLDLTDVYMKDDKILYGPSSKVFSIYMKIRLRQKKKGCRFEFVEVYHGYGFSSSRFLIELK